MANTTSKLDQLRALRERQHEPPEGRPKRSRPAGGSEPGPGLPATAPPQRVQIPPTGAKPKRDRRDYMRAYMREKRAKERAQKESR